MNALLTHVAAYSLLLAATSFFSPSLAQKKTAPQQKKQTIAVLDFDSRSGITRDEAASLSDIFAAEMVRTNEFTVVDRNRIKSILAEQGFQQSEACSQVECIVEAGKILKVEKMFVGTVGKIGETYSVNVQVVDVATSQIQQTASRTYEGRVDKLATQIVPDLAAEMASALTGKEITSSQSGTGTSWFWYVAGAGVVGGVIYFLASKNADNGGGPPVDELLPAAPTLP